MDSELQYFQKIIDEVRGATGVKHSITAVRYPPFIDMFSACNPAAAGLDEIAIPHGFRDCGYDRNELKAILAHEMGHIANNDWDRYGQNPSNIERRTAEQLADEFAAKHGFAKDSIRALQRAQGMPQFADDGTTHPAMAKRIDNFKRYL